LVLERKRLEEQPQVREGAKFVPIHARRAEPAATLRRTVHMHLPALAAANVRFGSSDGGHVPRRTLVANRSRLAEDVIVGCRRAVPEPERVNVSATIPGTSIECLLPGANSPAQFLNR